MASINIKQKIYTVAKILLVLGIIAVFFVGILMMMIVGKIPLNNFRLQRLEKDFQEANLFHPESILLQKKFYIGGPYDHGSLKCGVFIGELRASPLPKEKIRQAYVDRSIKSISYFNSKRIPIKVLFFDEGIWTMDSPLGDWWDEWQGIAQSASTPHNKYLVFVSQEEYSPLGDYRCDD